MWERVIRFRYMITEEAKKRCQILAFREKHGTSATTEAFNVKIGKKSIIHFHTYPRTPKMNAHCERLNRSLQEEFIDYDLNLLFDDVTLFNKKFADYLTFYNEKRVHTAFKNKYSPLQFMIQSNHYKINLPEECKNGWTYTMA